MQTSVFFSVLLIWVRTVLSNNYGLPVQLSYAPSTRIITQTNSADSQSNPSPRQLNRAYTIVYPLTFTQSRGGKPLNFTLSSQPPVINQVQSRVINKPELYPNFAIYTPFPVSPQESEEVIQSLQDIQDDTYDSSDLADDNTRIKKITFSPLPSQYFPAPIVYQNKTSDFATRPQTDKPSNPKFPSLGYGKYPPPAFKPGQQVSVKPVNPQQIFPPPKAPIKPVTPQQMFPPALPYPVIKSSVPQIKTTDNNYNDDINNPGLPTKSNKLPRANLTPISPVKNQIPAARPPVGKIQPVGYYKQQQQPIPSYVPRAPQYKSCICVPYYLCKNGVLNSAGRLQDFRKRSGLSLNYFRQNENDSIPFTSNIINLNPVGRNAECDANKVCCEIYFEDSIVDPNYNDNAYPVATPPPERPLFPPTRKYPTQPKPSNACGVQRALRMKPRLNQAQYPADVADFGEYPWQIAILKKVVGDKNLYLCGGVMVAPQWIATVAHCVNKYSNSPLLVRLGEWDVNRKDELYPYVEKDVTTMVIHPDFDSESLQGDLALLRLIEPVDSNLPHINPACLPKPGQVYEDQRCWVTGWGKNFFGPQGAYQNVLKEVDIPVISRSLCSSQLRSTNLGPDFVLHPGFLCAGGEVGKDACTGDGGSPLVCKSGGLWYVVGLVSWGIGCGQAGVPGVYVNVLYYTNWINNVIRNSQ